MGLHKTALTVACIAVPKYPKAVALSICITNLAAYGCAPKASTSTIAPPLDIYSAFLSMQFWEILKMEEIQFWGNLENVATHIVDGL